VCERERERINNQPNENNPNNTSKKTAIA